MIGQIRYSVDSRMSGFNDGISCNNAAADNNSSMGGRSASAVTLLLAGVEERIKKAGGGGEIPQKKPLTDPIEESGVTLTGGETNFIRLSTSGTDHFPFSAFL